MGIVRGLFELGAEPLTYVFHCNYCVLSFITADGSVHCRPKVNEPSASMEAISKRQLLCPRCQSEMFLDDVGREAGAAFLLRYKCTKCDETRSVALDEKPPAKTNDGGGVE